MDRDKSYEEYLEELSDATNTIDFVDVYGFDHECRCADDWKEGRITMASACFMGLAADALEKCFTFKGEVADLERKYEALHMQVKELGGEPRV